MNIIFKIESHFIQTKAGQILSLVAILQKGREKVGGPTGMEWYVPQLHDWTHVMEQSCQKVKEP